MELIDYLKDDHNIIRKFIKEFKSEENIKIKHKIYTELIIFLLAHFRAEETAVYSRSLKSFIREANELALDGYEEHHLLEDLIFRIKNYKNDDPLWLWQIEEFFQILDMHLSAEEADYFSELKSHFTAIEIDRVTVIYLKVKKFELALAQQEQGGGYNSDREINIVN